MTEQIRSPRLALPMTIVPDGVLVHLIAGEDIRYTLHVGEWASGFAELLRRCDGSLEEKSHLQMLTPEARRLAVLLIERLYAERLLVDAGPEDRQATSRSVHRIEVEGVGPLASRLQSPESERPAIRILCQTTLDYHAAHSFNQRCRAEQQPWIWVSTGAVQRAYVSPVFLPHDGPCLTCLLHGFRRISPAPQLYDALAQHARRDGVFAESPFPKSALDMVEQLVRWKVDLFGGERPALPVFRLHVLEVATMEVSLHRVLRDPVCPDCSHARFD